mgnify:CR=1 FL=1
MVDYRPEYDAADGKFLDELAEFRATALPGDKFIRLEPRHVGKSARLLLAAYESEKAWIVGHNKKWRQYLAEELGVDQVEGNKFKRITSCHAHQTISWNTHEYDLYVDEFLYLDDAELKKFLDLGWKSITMVSSIPTNEYLTDARKIAEEVSTWPEWKTAGFDLSKLCLAN